MPKQFPYMQWYPDDFEGDEVVKVMTFEEVGFYVHLLNHAWINDGLPGDLETIGRMFRLSMPELERLWKLVGQKFALVDGRYRNARQEKERAKAFQKSTLAVVAVNGRWEKTKNDGNTSVHTSVYQANNGSNAEVDTESIRGAYNASVSVSSTTGKIIISQETNPKFYDDEGNFDPRQAFVFLTASYPKAGRVRLKIAFDMFLNQLIARENGVSVEERFAEMLEGLGRWNASEQWRRGAVNGIVNFFAEFLWREYPQSSQEAAKLHAVKPRDGPPPTVPAGVVKPEISSTEKYIPPR